MRPYLILHPSRYFLIFLLLCHLGAVAAITVLPLPIWGILLLTTLLAANLVYDIRRHIVRKSPQTPLKLWLDEKDQWFLSRRDKLVIPVSLLGDSFCSAFVIILNFKPIPEDKKPRRISVVIFPDSVDPASYRELKAWMAIKRLS